MNIVYLIGNGFDLNLGMRTRYEHFYKYLNTLHEKLSLPVRKLITKINRDPENWSDFELKLGGYLNDIEKDEAIDLIKDLISLLSEYITSEEKCYNLNAEQKYAFGEYLRNPHGSRRLPPIDANMINQYIGECTRHSGFDVKVITFNYTKSIEHLLGYPKVIDSKFSSTSSVNITSLEIEHIHGHVDSRLILGVNDASQILSENLKNDPKIISRYIKSNRNKTYRLGHDEICQEWLASAQLICLFGLSLGDTDKQWWEIVGERLKHNIRLIIFEHNSKYKFNGNQGPDMMDAEDSVRDKFLSKTKLDKELREKAKRNIYVACNTAMFSFPGIKRKEGGELPKDETISGDVILSK